MKNEFGILLLAVLTTAAQATNLSDVILNGMSSGSSVRSAVGKSHSMKDSYYGGKDFSNIIVASR